MVNQFAQLSIHDVPVQMIPFGQINAGPPPYGPVPHMNHRPPPHHQPPPSLQPPPPHLQQAAYDRYQQENRGGTTYFYQEPTDGPPDEEHYHDADVGDGCMMVVIFPWYHEKLKFLLMSTFRRNYSIVNVYQNYLSGVIS